MIREPYIFLSQNYAKYATDETANALSFKNLEISSFPYVLDLYLTDKYGNYVNHDIDTLLLENTNLQNMKIEYKKNGRYYPLFKVFANIDDTVLIKISDYKSVCALRITITGNDNPSVVRIGKLGCYKYLCDLYAETDSSFKVDANSGSYRTLSGNVVYYGDYGKWESKIKIANLPKAQFDILTHEIKDTTELTIVPFKDFDLSAIYECYVDPAIEYEVNRKTELYELKLEAQEL